MLKISKLITLASAGTLLAASAAGANAMAVSADYTLAATADGDENIVAAFSLYDFAVGATLIQAGAGNLGSGLAPVIGDTFKGYYQSYVTSHQLNGVVQAAAGLNTSGAGSGYELTVVAEFDEVVTSLGPNGSYNSAIVGGSATLFFDTTPDFNFLSGTGFSDGEVILTGTIVGGGSVSIPTLAAGFAQIDVAVSGVSSAIFTPDISAANGIFSLALNSNAVNGVTSVLGRAVGAGDLLLGADGNLQLQPVPLPAAAWLLGSALIGIASISRRTIA